MEALSQMIAALPTLLPALAVLACTLLLLKLVRKVFLKHPALTSQHALLQSLLLVLIVLGGAVGVIIALPINDSTRSNLMTLLGIVTSAAIALSSATFVGNAMAGFLLRIVRNFRPGDFVRVGEHFGRVSEEGIFHIELQTEESNLTTLPNLYLVTQPVTVIRACGTIVSASVSLGYDVPHVVVERVLAQAATDAGLKEPYVQITDLGDFSVSYRCAGMLESVKGLLAAKSRLRAKMIDRLHENGIEIVSPAYMNQRRLPATEPVIPEPPSDRSARNIHPAEGPNEEMVFDKAERAAGIEELRARVQEVINETTEQEKKLADETDEAARAKLTHKLDRNRVYRDYLETRLKRMQEQVRQEDDTVM